MSKLFMPFSGNLLLFLSCLLWGCFEPLSAQNTSATNPSSTETVLINQPEDIKTAVVQRMAQQLKDYPQEKIYLHTDKPYYSAGDTIWFKAYMVHAALHQSILYSRYVYVELINEGNEVIFREKIRPENNLFYCQIPIKAEIIAGNYTLRAYTNYMRNLDENYFFRKDIYIGNAIQKTENDSREQILNSPQQANESSNHNAEQNAHSSFDVQFFPEGGHLISGCMQTIGFKAIDKNGWGTDVHGRIVDQDQQEVSTFNSMHLGMGLLSLYTESGKQYTAICENNLGEELKVNLPAPSDSAYALSISQRGGRINVYVLTPNSSLIQQPLHIIVHTRGIPLFKADITAENPVLALPKSALPSGVMQVLLLNDNADILSERLVYIHNDDQAHAQLIFNKPSGYAKRERAYATLSVTDSQGTPLSGNFSMSVTDNSSIVIDSTALSIDSYLLLTSELKGNIEQPEAYFLPSNKNAAIQLDILLLTQGWRRYDIPKVVKGEIDPLNRYELEIGSILCGKLQSYPIRRAIPGVNISVFNAKNGYINAVTTDRSGRFCINGFEFPDSSSFFLQAEKKQGSIMELVVDNQDFPNVSIPRIFPIEDKENDIMKRFLHNSRDRYYYENGSMIINLEAATVTAKKSDNIRQERGAMYSYASYTFESQEIEDMGGATLLDVLMQAPGVTLNANGDGVLIRNATPLIVVDNIPREMSELNTISVFDVEMIDILKDPAQTAIYQGGNNGVICIYLKRGEKNSEIELGSHQKVVPYIGYTSPKAFYQPMYSVEKIRNSQAPDLRSTIYWKPDIFTDQNGLADVFFYVADEKSTYTVLVEGITDNGKLVRCLQSISRK